MHLVSHRGNITGKQPELENTPLYIREAVDQGYDVEIDVWADGRGTLYLGHDGPETQTNVDFLKSGPYVIHAKNSLAIEPLQFHNLHWFWHDTDDYTLTSHGWVWAYPNKTSAGKQCVAVLPEIHNTPIDGFWGVCSDYIERYK